MMRTPPRLAYRLLALVPHEHRESVTGDLVQEYHRLVDAGSPFHAWLWFWRETIGILWSLGARWATFADDLWVAQRTLRRSPTFVILCSGTLAIGIGAMTAIFSVVDPLIIRPLPYANPSRLLMVWEKGGDGLGSTTGYATYADIAQQTHTLESLAVISLWQPVIGHTDPERVTGERVTASYFPTLGVQPMLGRGFTADDDRPGHNQVVLLSHAIWRRRFGADPDVVGRAITINGVPYTVVGVMPATFDDVIWPGAQLWQPLGYDATLPNACRTCRHLQMIARSRATPPAVLAELNVISARIVAAHPKDYSAAGMLIDPLQDAVTHAYRPVLLAIAGAVMLLLLIATANVAGLQLARGVRRRREFSVRRALGAGRIELARQLLAESLCIAMLGGTGGLVIARFILPALVSELPSGMPRIDAIHLDASALGVATLTMLTIGVVLGLMSSPRRATLRKLVVVEFALALMLLVGAGLMGRSLVRLLAVHVGFDPEHVVSLELNAAGPAYAPDAAVYAYHDHVLAAVRAIPGVERAALASELPLGGDVDRYGVAAQDKPLDNPALAPDADRYVVSSDFFETMRIPLLHGRTLLPTDFADSAAKVVVVGHTLAARVWPGEDAIGKRLQVGGPDAPWRTVVGVVGDIHHQSLDANGTGQFYVPEREWLWSDNADVLVVRVGGDPAAFAAAVRRVVAAVDPTVPISRVETMQHVVLASTAQRRIAMVLFSVFAVIALLLAAGGVYGVLASNVAERTREIGVRSALGATPSQIIRMFVTQGVRLAFVGTVIGLAAAVVLTRFLRALLFEIQPMDPLTLTLVGAMLGAVAVIACLVPSIRAIRIEPVAALKSD